ncbi:hypothetical protein DL89DRAFT_313591 [Linderina pennispora]|uniref:Uncharacterized protein n=1 Tax=Linderina pennispora TaxID=61395 RepID=A0A1Y1WCX4_9FUNG|nr:uncharacterized protein DL89DRAFT_313591 [Linderina pennispora]ORX71397.1 hypothetical protein DL89DRAFT_313591 [Linderina pennispora]
MPSRETVLFVNGGSIFTSETIGDIVYLKYNEHYLYCSEDGGWQIKLMPELPEENERLHLQYDRKMLTFSRWNKIGCLHVSWYRHTGDVYFLKDNVIDPYDECLTLELVKI